MSNATQVVKLKPGRHWSILLLVRPDVNAQRTTRAIASLDSGVPLSAHGRRLPNPAVVKMGGAHRHGAKLVDLPPDADINRHGRRGSKHHLRAIRAHSTEACVVTGAERTLRSGAVAAVCGARPAQGFRPLPAGRTRHWVSVAMVPFPVESAVAQPLCGVRALIDPARDSPLPLRRPTAAQLLQMWSTHVEGAKRAGAAGNLTLRSHLITLQSHRHVVALGDAWTTGAATWTAAKREQLANDPLNLPAVSASLNRAKGDRDAASWLPPVKAYRCAYVARQVAVKAHYGLWVTSAEHDAIARVLTTCPDERTP